MEPLLITVLFSAAIIIGIFAVLFGGTLFLSLPLFQILFPEMTFGALIGNIKLGSVVRNLAAAIPVRKHLDLSLWPLALTLCAGSLIGALLISEASNIWVPAALLVGMIVSERAAKINIPQPLFWLVAFITGLYGGILGAGIMLLIIALLQLRYKDLVSARANAVVLELAISVVAVIVFIRFDLIDWQIALVWATGAMIGGYIGGTLLNKTTTFSPVTQQWFVQGAFVFAIAVSIYSII